MSYLVLARKWRPQQFKDVVGQKPILRTLQNALKRKRVAHAMVFSGVRGVGKTTLARIMAKAINCQEETSEPCDICSSCLAIKNGSAMDLHEIDGASNRGIQEIRDLKENLRFLPSEQKYKVIIIDEVHMLTTEAFNALLKTLEEPPEHVYFMFATTELHKVPVTILSRCQRYELKRISFAELVEFFKQIAEKEQVKISESALEIIAGQADGSVRDGLSLLDQIFSFGGDTVTQEDLSEVLGLVDRQIFSKLAENLLAGNLGASLQLLNDSYNQGLDLKRFSHDLLNFFRSLLVIKACKGSTDILDVSDRELATINTICGQHSTETISNIFNLLLKSIEEMQYSSQPRMVLEVSFIKATQAGNVVPLTDLISKLDSLLAGNFETEDVADTVLAAPTASKKTEEKKSDIEIEVTPSVNKVVDQNKTDVLPAETASEKPITVDKPFADKPEADTPKADTPETTVVRTSAKDVVRDWDGFLGHVKERKTWMSSILGVCEKAIEHDGELQITFDDLSECLYLKESSNLTLLTEFAQDFFQKELTVKIIVKGGEAGDKQQLDQPQEERRALANDPRVQMALEVIGGQVTGIRTGPRSR